jgi:SAM-dependent methyltransferase
MSRLVENSRVYDLIQRGMGYELTARRLRAALGGAGGEQVLDVGAGTGNLAPLLPASSTYLPLEPDPAKLVQLRAKLPGVEPLQRMSTATGLADGAVGWTVCVAVSHHLDDEQLVQTVAELARVTRDRLVFIDAVWDPAWLPGRLLWRLDRGNNPRTAEQLKAALGTGFAPLKIEHYRGAHRYLLYIAQPKRP